MYNGKTGCNQIILYTSTKASNSNNLAIMSNVCFNMGTVIKLLKSKNIKKWVCSIPM